MDFVKEGGSLVLLVEGGNGGQRGWIFCDEVFQILGVMQFDE